MSKRSGTFSLLATPSYPFFPSVRALVAFLLLLVAFAVNMDFFTLNFAIVCMVNATYLAEGKNVSNNNHSLPGCAQTSAAEATEYHGTFLWDKNVQATLLAGEGWGAIWFIVLTGWFLDRYGAKWLQFVSLMLLALVCFLVPVSASHGWEWAFVCRFFQGIGMETAWPAILAVSTRWFPVSEYGLVSAIGFSGFQLAPLFTMGLTGYFCRSSWGWQGAFYFMGALTVVIAVLWILLFTDNITRSHWISPNEVHYITRNRGCHQTLKEDGLPLKQILTSLPVWAIIVMNFAIFYMYYFIADYGPTYFKEVLGLGSTTNGVLAALPFIAQFVGQLVSGIMSDYAHTIMPVTASVKISSALSGFIPAVCMIAFTFFDCHGTAGAVACMTIAFFFIGFSIGGFLRSASLIAPQYSGTTAGLGTTAIYVAGIVSPYITGAVTPDSTQAQWRIAYIIASAIAVIGTVFFLIFGSGELQSWARSRTAKTNQKIYAVTNGNMIQF